MEVAWVGRLPDPCGVQGNSDRDVIHEDCARQHDGGLHDERVDVLLHRPRLLVHQELYRAQTAGADLEFQLGPPGLVAIQILIPHQRVIPQYHKHSDILADPNSVHHFPWDLHLCGRTRVLQRVQ